MPKIMSGVKKRKIYRIELGYAQQNLSKSPKKKKQPKISEDELLNLVVFSTEQK